MKVSRLVWLLCLGLLLSACGRADINTPDVEDTGVPPEGGTGSDASVG